MTPTTPTGKRLADALSLGVKVVGAQVAQTRDILAIEAEKEAEVLERLRAEGWHEPSPDCGPIKAQPHEHRYLFSDIRTSRRDPDLGVPCVDCGHLYGADR